MRCGAPTPAAAAPATAADNGRCVGAAGGYARGGRTLTAAAVAGAAAAVGAKSMPSAAKSLLVAVPVPVPVLELVLVLVVVVVLVVVRVAGNVETGFSAGLGGGLVCLDVSGGALSGFVFFQAGQRRTSAEDDLSAGLGRGGRSREK